MEKNINWKRFVLLSQISFLNLETMDVKHSLIA